MGRKYHARCAYCGATEGEEWVTSSGKYGSGKIYCSPDCRAADGAGASLCFGCFTLLLLLYLTTSFIIGAPWYIFPSLALVFSGIPILCGIQGLRARERVLRRSSQNQYHK